MLQILQRLYFVALGVENVGAVGVSARKVGIDDERLIVVGDRGIFVVKSRLGVALATKVLWV